MKILMLLIISILITCFIILIPINYSYNRKIIRGTEMYTFFNSHKDKYHGPKICFLAGVHGNEIAGVIALQKLLNGNYLKKFISGRCGFIKVIPVINKWGYHRNIRWRNSFFQPDINRGFLDSSHEKINDPLINKILDFIDDVDVIVDFHEALDFYKNNSGSIGSTISPGYDKLSQHISKIIQYGINKSIPEHNMKFEVIQRICYIRNTLGCYITNRTRKSYILIETTRRQSVKVRVQQVQDIIKIILHELWDC